MFCPKHPLTNPHHTGWSDDNHPTPIPIVLPNDKINASQSGYQYSFSNPKVYGKNYCLIYPDGFQNLPKYQFPLNTPIPNAFTDKWIKP